MLSFSIQYGLFNPVPCTVLYVDPDLFAIHFGSHLRGVDERLLLKMDF